MSFHPQVLIICCSQEHRCSTSLCSVLFFVMIPTERTPMSCAITLGTTVESLYVILSLYSNLKLSHLCTRCVISPALIFRFGAALIGRSIHTGCGNFFLSRQRAASSRRYISRQKHTETSDPVNLSGTGRALMPLCTIHHSLTVPRSCSDLFFAHFKDFSFLLFVINSVNVIRGVCVCARSAGVKLLMNVTSHLDRQVLSLTTLD